MNDVCQILIPILSGGSIWAFAGKKHKLGFILGLVGQPCWFYSTFVTAQWGMFLISFWFTFNHVRGLMNHRSEI